MSTVDLPSGLGISGIAPATGPNSGGTAITISGNGFQSGATVTVSGVACTSVTVVNPTSITCTTPAKSMTCGPTAIVVTNPDSQTTMRSDLFAYQSGTLGFAAMTTFNTGAAPRHLAVDDWNGDGKLDLAVGLITAGQVNIHNGDGIGNFAAGTPISTGMQPRMILSKDLNGDGKPDLVVSNQLSNNATVHLNTGTSFGNPTTLSTNTMGPEGSVLTDVKGV